MVVYLLTQFFTIPVTMSAPCLSLLYQVNAVKQQPFSPGSNHSRWRDRNAHLEPLAFVDLRPGPGQAVSLTFRLEQAVGVPAAWAMLDSATVGAAALLGQ